MIPAVPAAALAGLVLMLLAALLGAGLLSWWGWRLWHQRRGRPRPPLRIWQWGLAVLLSILPISAVVGLAEFAWNDHRQTQQVAEQERLMHITLAQPVVWGEITLPAGSHIERDMPEAGLERPDGQPDLSALRNVRFPKPLQVDGLWVNALSVYNQLVLELAQPHHLAARPGQPAQDCPAGYMLQYGNRQKQAEQDMFRMALPVLAPTLVMADWVADACYQSTPIQLRYWQGDQLVWAKAPEYALPE